MTMFHAHFLKLLRLIILTVTVLVLPAQADQEPIASPPAFSDLSPEQQRNILHKIASPPVAQRDAPYSTPMYYLPYKGYQAGFGSMEPDQTGNFVLDRNRPEIQEQLLQDWVELGLTGTHFLVSRASWNNSHYRVAFRDYLDLSEKHGLRVSIRFGGLEGRAPELHPDNLHNDIEGYMRWVREVVTTCSGRVWHYTFGDEFDNPAYRDSWPPATYLEVFKQFAKAVRSVEPDATLGGQGLAGLNWAYAEELFDLGYGKVANGIGANFRDYPPEVFHEFVRRVKERAPHFGIYSNGHGWVAAKETPMYPASDQDPRWLFASEEDQAAIIAQRVFKLFDAGWNHTPYYITVRKWVLPDGSLAPTWYGAYGFQDLVMDDYGNMTIKRYPAWYAYQTIANIFWSQSQTNLAPFKVKLSEPVDYQRAYVRNDTECLLVLWNNPPYQESDQEIAPQERNPTSFVIPQEKVPDLSKPERITETKIDLPTQDYGFPVQISLLSYRNLTDLPYQLTGDNRLVISNVRVGIAPVIIRLVAVR